MEKIYIVTRRDLPIGQQAAQSVHGIREFIEAYPEIDKSWYSNSNTIVILAVKNEEELINIANKAKSQNMSCALFKEPDLQDQVTVATFGPECKKILSSIPLAFKLYN